MNGSAGQAAAGDIEAVLSRFQAWTGARPPRTAREGVREISYEEALESSRSRWKRHADPAPETNPPINPQMNPQKNPQKNPETNDTLRPEPGVIPIAAPLPPAFAVIPPVTAHLDDAPAPTTAPRVRRVPRKKEHFSALLAKSVAASAPGSSLARSWVAGDERQVSMSLRVAASEQALIKIRAAEAGISASAYLRQCALEVEGLRAQVQQFLAASPRRRLEDFSDPAWAPAPRTRPGWLSRMKWRLLGQRTTTLSLKI